jgi:TatD DNase family protein
MLADSHCHLDQLDLTPYNGSLAEAIEAARLKDVDYILCPGLILETFPNILKIAQENKNVFAACGVHPTEDILEEPTLDALITLGQNKKVVAIGETGLDYYRDKSKIEQQKKLFRLHIQAAKILKKPLIIHSRDADNDLVKILNEEKANELGGVMHCFTGNQELANQMLELGFYISFAGIVTFPNAHNLREVAKNIPLEKILIETDAPYLAPVPVRGKPNEPSYLPYIAEFMAKLLNISYDKFSAQITENFLKLFSI